MTTPVTYSRGAAEQSLLTTELNALANDALALGSEITLADAGYLLADLTLVVTYDTQASSVTESRSGRECTAPCWSAGFSRSGLECRLQPVRRPFRRTGYYRHSNRRAQDRLKPALQP